MSHSSLTYRPDIDGLRAAAVLAVIGYHAYPNSITGGFVGVDIFFVISGFLISGLIFKALQEKNFRLTDFYARRIRRIFPALGLVLFTCLILGWFLLFTDEYIQLGKHTFIGAAFGPNFVLMREVGYFDNAAELKPMLHLWSLGIEEQFYIVWPFTLALLWRRKSLVPWAIAIIALASFALNIYYMAQGEPGKSFYLPLTRCWELLAGAALAYFSIQFSSRLDDVLSRSLGRLLFGIRWRDVLSGIGIIGIATAIAGIDREAAFPGWWALLPALGTFLIIAAGSEAWLNRQILAHPVLVFIGLISYPLYLWHWPLLAFARITTDSDPGSLQTAAILLASFILSGLTFYFWETPLRKNQSSWNLVALALLMVSVGVTGRLIQKSHGYPGRFPSNIQSIASTPYSYSYAKSYRLGLCFVDGKKDGADAFSNQCLEPASGASKKIFLWGDSHAAHLYPGLRQYEQENHFRVIQFTAGGCPPLADVEIPKRPLCKAINDRVLRLLGKVIPDVVIMAANWTEDQRAWNYTDLMKLSKTIAAIKDLGVGKIVLFGPVPVWSPAAPKLLVKHSQLNDWRDPPDRFTYGFAKETEVTDERISAFAEKNHISYVSPYRTFCDSQGCLAKLGDTPTVFDCCHLTDVGSAFLIKSNLSRILDSSPTPTQPVKAAWLGKTLNLQP